MSSALNSVICPNSARSAAAVDISFCDEFSAQNFRSMPVGAWAFASQKRGAPFAVLRHPEDGWVAFGLRGTKGPRSFKEAPRTWSFLRSAVAGEKITVAMSHAD
ncbi:hypothetical protein [Phreatobacter cathodiphilus]|uniref:hypothetical protein n=1 Tax=Phreatobacter cathodiphilus TaxID=1868589 RepID=UPI0011B27C5C|nr:hypothetical protein [Phreatobacter cathodiphilus]